MLRAWNASILWLLLSASLFAQQSHPPIPGLQQVLGSEQARFWGVTTRLLNRNNEQVILTEARGHVAMFDAVTLQRVSGFKAHDHRCLDLALVDDGSKLITVALGGSVRLWNLEESPPRLLDEVRYPVDDGPLPWLKLSASRDGRLLAIRSDQALRLFKVENDKFVERNEMHPYKTKDIPFQFCVSPNGKWLLSCELLESSELVAGEGGINFGYRDAKLVLWELDDGKLSPTFISNCKALENIQFVDDTHFVATDPYFVPDPKIYDWSIVDEQLRLVGDRSARAASFGSLVAQDNGLRAFNYNGHIEVLRQHGEEWLVDGEIELERAFALAIVGDDIITAAYHFLQRWSKQDGKYVAVAGPDGAWGNIDSLHFDPQLRSVITKNDAGILQWPLPAMDAGLEADETPHRTTESIPIPYTESPRNAQFEPTEHAVLHLRHITGQGRVLDGTVFRPGDDLMFQIKFGEDYREAAWSADVHPNGKLLATGHWDHTIRFWDITDEPKQIAEWKAHRGHVCDVTFSPDGRLLASASWDHATKIWELDPADFSGPKDVRALSKEHDDIVRCVSFSPNGQFVASGGEGGDTRVWDLKHPNVDPVVLLAGKRDPAQQSTVGSLQFSRDNQRLLAADGSGRVVIWAHQDAQILKAWQLPGWVWEAQFGPQERWVGTANDNGTVYILDTQADDQ